MAVQADQVSVGTSATSLLTSGVAGARVLIRNAGAASVFLGASDVTTGTGFELATGETVELPVPSGSEVFGIVATGSETVHVLSA